MRPFWEVTGRKVLILPAIFVAGSIVGLAIALAANGSVSGTEPSLWILSLYTFAFVGFALFGHAKEMLGGPLSRLTPGLCAPHLAVAGVLAAVLVIAVPFAVFAIAGSWRDGFLVVAFNLASVSIPTFFVERGRRWAVLLYAGYILSIGAVVVYPSTALAKWYPQLDAGMFGVALLPFSIACLAALAIRLANLNEEMAGYHTWFLSDRSDSRLAANTLGRPWLLWSFFSGNLRGLGGDADHASTGILHRARHWHAAWGTAWAGAGFGLVVCLCALSWRLLLGIFASDQWLAREMALFDLVFIGLARWLASFRWPRWLTAPAAGLWSTSCFVPIRAWSRFAQSAWPG